MKLKAPLRSSGLILSVIGLGIFACNATQLPFLGESQSSLEVPSEDAIRLNPADTAAALADPERVETGVWSLLANLGIGVYTGDGEQVLAGSETGSSDFWIYDFEVPILGHMALQEPRPFSATHDLLASLGYEGSPEELVQVFEYVYSQFPDAFLVKLFSEMGLTFESQANLTPLQEWLILLDTLVPPNGTRSEAASGSEESELDSDVGTSPEYLPPCGEISAGWVRPNWGIIKGSTDLAKDVEKVMEAADAYYAMHGRLISEGINALLVPLTLKVHEGHGAPELPVEFTVIGHLSPGIPPFEFPVQATSCGPLVNYDSLFLSGPIDGAQVFWDVDPEFYNHGEVVYPGPEFYIHGNRVIPGDSKSTITDASGETRIEFIPREEWAGGEGREVSIPASINASINIKSYLERRYGNPHPSLLRLVPDRVPVGNSVEVKISWHEARLYFRYENESTIQDGASDLSILEIAEGWLEPRELDGSVVGDGRFEYELVILVFDETCGETKSTQFGEGDLEIEGTLTENHFMIKYSGKDDSSMLYINSAAQDAACPSTSVANPYFVENILGGDLDYGRYELERELTLPSGPTSRISILVEARE